MIPMKLTKKWINVGVVSVLVCNVLILLAVAITSLLKIKDKYFDFDVFIYDVTTICLMTSVICLVLVFIGFLGGKYIFLYGTVTSYLAGMVATIFIVDAVGFDGLAVLMIYVVYIIIGVSIGLIIQANKYITKKKDIKEQWFVKQMCKPFMIIYIIILIIPMMLVTGQHVVGLLSDIDKDTPKFANSFEKTDHESFVEDLFAEHKYSDYSVEELRKSKGWLSRLKFDENVQLSYQEGYILLTAKEFTTERDFKLFKMLTIDIINIIEFRRYHAEVTDAFINHADLARETGLTGFWTDLDLDTNSIDYELKYSKSKGYEIWFQSPVK